MKKCCRGCRQGSDTTRRHKVTRYQGSRFSIRRDVIGSTVAAFLISHVHTSVVTFASGVLLFIGSTVAAFLISHVHTSVSHFCIRCVVIGSTVAAFLISHVHTSVSHFCIRCVVIGSTVAAFLISHVHTSVVASASGVLLSAQLLLLS